MAAQFQETDSVLLKLPELDILQHLVIIGKNGSDFGEFRDAEGISTQESTGLIYVSDSQNHRIQISSKTGQVVNQFGEQHLRQPWGILIYEDCAFVSDWTQHAIFIFALSDLSMLNRIGKEGCGKEEFNCPSGLDISPNNHIYIADCFNDRLQILNCDLDFIGCLRHQTMSRPVDLKFSSTNQILVLSVMDNPCLHILTLSGEKIRSIITRGVGMQVTLAYYFCLNGDNRIIISDSSGHDVKIFSDEGDLLQIIGECGFGPGMFHFPRGVAMLRETSQICVSNSNDFTVQIFSVN